MIKTKIKLKMIHQSDGNLKDIEHFLKVYAYAQLIGEAELLDEHTQGILEIAALVHDIACPLCREKYGSTGGNYQEIESEALLRPFLAEYQMDTDMLERIIYLVTHHHTYEGVTGADYQILLEADFLVNASEGKLSKEAIRTFHDRIAKTETGKQLLRSIYNLT